MAKDYIGYKALADSALRGVVRDALRRVEKQGLIGAHHFRLTFKTRFPGVDIPDFLREQYPDEMMIILQHQFWGLKVREDQFEVTLSFRKIPATLTIPFSALTAFVDPGVQFSLHFRETEEAGTGETARPNLVPAVPQAAQPAGPAAESPPAAEKPASAPGEVVSLDSFRKK